MFCGNCGNQIPDDSQFCGNCGTVLWPESCSRDNPNEGGFFKKDVYFVKKANSKNKVLYFISWGLVFLCLLSIILSANVAINGDLLQSPIGKIADSMTDGELTQLELKLSDRVAEIEQIADERDGVQLEFLEAYLKLSENFSLNNLHQTGAICAEMYDDMGEEQDAADLRDSMVILRIFIVTLVICFVITGILTILSALFKNFPLAIVAIVLAVDIVLIFAGIIWALFALAAYIGLIVVYAKMGSAYKAYKRTCFVE